MIRILDSYSLLVFLEKESGYEKIESIFVTAVERNSNLLMTSVNYGEIYYIVLRECGQEKVNEIETTIHALPIEIISVDIHLAKEAARFKATKKISYADCFAAALAKINKGELITGDKEFMAVENDVQIMWL